MRLLLALALSLFAATAYAAEGGVAEDASFGNTEAFYLCDGVHSGSEACGEIDLRSLGGRSKKTPATIQFAIYRQTAACTPTVTVYGRLVGTTVAGATQVDHSIIALLGTGTSSMSPAVPTLFRIYYATVSADADCADLEVVALLHYNN